MNNEDLTIYECDPTKYLQLWMSLPQEPKCCVETEDAYYTGVDINLKEEQTEDAIKFNFTVSYDERILKELRND